MWQTGWYGVQHGRCEAQKPNFKLLQKDQEGERPEGPPLGVCHQCPTMYRCMRLKSPTVNLRDQEGGGPEGPQLGECYQCLLCVHVKAWEHAMKGSETHVSACVSRKVRGRRALLWVFLINASHYARW